MGLDRMEELINALGEYKKNKHNGYIKIGIEYSRCSSIVMANTLEVKTSPIIEEFKPENFFRKLGSDYFGSIIYLFENGVIKEYAYCKNYKGEAGLNNFIRGK